jgi:hypothetical protein
MSTHTVEACGETLRHIAVMGGCVADGQMLRHFLGGASFRVKNELRLIELGCADTSIVERVRAVIEAQSL